MSKDYIYKTDGVVLTPIDLAVGDNDDNKSPKVKEGTDYLSETS